MPQGRRSPALGTRIKIADVDMTDAVNRTRTVTVSSTTGQLTSDVASSYSPGWYYFHSEPNYDDAGNTTGTWTLEQPQNGTWTFNEDRSYYGADGRLAYYNRAEGFWLEETPSVVGSFDEYRYDALGRRVLTRTRRLGSCR